MCSEQQKPGFRWQEMAYAIALLLLIGAVVYYVRQPKLAVVDLKRVASEVGADRQMKTDLVSIRKQAAGQVEKLRDGFKADVDRLKERASSAESEDEKTQLREEMQDIQQKAELSAKRIELDVARKTEEMLQVFHAKLKPAIDDVARKHRVDVVIDSRKETGVLYANSRVDLTGEVIKKALANGEFKPSLTTVTGPVGDTDGVDLKDAGDLAEVEITPSAETPAEEAKAPAKEKNKTR